MTLQNRNFVSKTWLHMYRDSWVNLGQYYKFSMIVSGLIIFSSFAIISFSFNHEHDELFYIITKDYWIQNCKLWRRNWNCGGLNDVETLKNAIQGLKLHDKNSHNFGSMHLISKIQLLADSGQSALSENAKIKLALTAEIR